MFIIIPFKMKRNRRTFLKNSGQAALGMGLLGIYSCADANATKEAATANAEETTTEPSSELFFQLSLAQWSLHNMLFDGKLDNLDFPAFTKKEFGIEAVEYVNQFFGEKGTDQAYLTELKKRADDNGVKSLIIMVDREGNLGDTDANARQTAVENHFKWLEAAKFLGCHSIRVNAFGVGTADEVKAAAIDGLGKLATEGQKYGLNVIVENHGGYSSDGKWLTDVMAQINLPNCGTLPDFGNFCIEREGGAQWDGKCINEYDRYLGVQEMMPYAKSVSAKSHNFDANGNETNTDYLKMMQIVKDAGYTGYVGVEYEGTDLSELEGIKATRDLLLRVGSQLK